MSVRPAPRGRRAEGIALLATAALVLVADQLTKALVVANLPVGDRVNVVGEVVQLWHAENAGAAFSLLQNAQFLFMAVTGIALVVIAYFFWSLSGRSLWLFGLLGLTLGGFVTDFISVGIGGTRWPTFNVADASIDVGIVLLVLALTLGDRRTASPQSSEAGH
jgi:signal peptidase II